MSFQVPAACPVLLHDFSLLCLGDDSVQGRETGATLCSAEEARAAAGGGKAAHPCGDFRFLLLICLLSILSRQDGGILERAWALGTDPVGGILF